MLILQIKRKETMSSQIKWFERKFNFDFNQNIFPATLERLAGTPARLDEKLSQISADKLLVRLHNTWTIKENIGHLIDLEPLWQGRLEDILQGQTEMRPTDLQNTRSTEANHDAVPTEDLLKRFRVTRKQTIDMLEPLTEVQIFKSALHPRLKTPMRTIDLFLFVADHDDHHLARVTELARLL
jgi:uncharacterized damage-inducible protein DinB